MSNIKDKVILVTGASSGIGEASARLLAANGAKVVVGARRTDRLEKLVADIRRDGGTAEYTALDVVDRQNVKDFVAFAKDTFGRVDVLFNNAGVMPLSPLAALKVGDWDRMIDVNIKGVLNGIAAALPVMEAQGSGHILNTSSVAGHVVFPTSAVYCGTKFAVKAISEGLRMESKTVRVTLITPGAIATELGHDITDASTIEMLGQFKGLAIAPDAIARAVLYAVEQPPEVDVNEIVVRPLAQSL
jgi:NADP-dependent 3-hydroxy acid dehydrogenase YdfG